MKTGFVNPRPHFPKTRQIEVLLAQGVPAHRIIVNGDDLGTLDVAMRFARDSVIHCAEGLRGLAGSAKEIRQAMAELEGRGRVVFDADANERTDKHAWKMYDRACKQVAAERSGLSPRTARKGGNARAARLEADRLDEDRARIIWKNVKRFDTDQDACDHMNELHPFTSGVSDGWNPQLARRHFESSGRPRGNRSFKLQRK